MKRRSVAITLCSCACLVIASCKEQPSLPPDARHGAAVSSKQDLPPRGTASLDSAGLDSILLILVKLEDGVRDGSADKNPAALLLNVSFDSASGCFMVAGKGKGNPSLPRSAGVAGRRMAAAYDAKRWSLYLKAFRDNRNTSFGENISGEIAYSRTLLERTVGDTLLLLLQVPVGSIVVK
jgi:hypothetical protein